MGEDSDSHSEEVFTSNESYNLSVIAEAIAGDGPDKLDLTWIEGNITSIQKAVLAGKHDKLFYPASGTDILRALIAYDATEVVAVDSGSDLIPRIVEQFDKAEIPLSITKVDEVTDELSCTLGGKQRKITFQRTDARLVIDELEPGSIDVLHIYFPTGADMELTEKEVWLQNKFGDEWRWKQGADVLELMKQDPDAPIANEDGKYKRLGTEVRGQLTLDNYNLVRVGGFIIFNENSLSPFGETSPILLKIAGLDEQKIISRHPMTVMSSFYPTQDQLSSMDRTGYLYHKQGSASTEVVNDVISGLELRDITDYQLMEVQRGGFDYIGIDAEHTDLSVALEALVKDQLDQTEQIAQSMASHGVSAENVEAYKIEQRNSLMAGLRKIQEEYQDFLAAYEVISAKVRAGEADNNEALKELGIVQGQYGKESRRWPIALAYIRDANKEGSHTADTVHQLSEFDLSKL